MPRRPRAPELSALLTRLSERGEDAPSLPEILHIIGTIRGMGPEASSHLDRFLAERQARLSHGIEQLQEVHRELREKVRQLVAPPWPTAIFLEMLAVEEQTDEGGPASDSGESSEEQQATDGGDRPDPTRERASRPVRQALIHDGRSRIIVNVDPEADLDELVPGDEVLLSPERTVLLRATPSSWLAGGELAQFDRLTDDGRLVIRARDQEFLAVASGRLDAASLEPGDQVQWDRRLPMVLERVPRPSKSDLFLEETPEVTFAEIGGLDRVIEKIKRSVLLRRLHPDKSSLYDVRSGCGLLLSGPPGNGKTMLARALANWLASLTESGRSLFMGIKPGQLLTPWYGESEANIRKVFAIAHRAARAEPEVPVLMFFDEIDSIGRARSQRLSRVGDQVLPAFMEELNGVTPLRNILVVAATNRADALDPALMRPGRLLDELHDVPRPGRSAARAIFACHLGPSVPIDATVENAEEARANLIDVAVTRLYARNGHGPVAKLLLRDGTRREVTARDLVSGAAIANIMRVARASACWRDAEGGDVGVRPDDVLVAIDSELEKLSRPLTPGNAHLYVADLPEDNPVVGIERPERVEETHTFLRIA